MKTYRRFKNVVHATPTLAEAMERFRQTGQFILSTDNSSAYEYEDTRPESLDLSNVRDYRVNAFEQAAIGDNSQVKTVPRASVSDNEPAPSGSGEPASSGSDGSDGGSAAVSET